MKKKPDEKKLNIFRENNMLKKIFFYQSSWVAPVITNKDPGKSGNLIKLGGPFFFLNSKTLTAPRDTEATDGFRPN